MYLKGSLNKQKFNNLNKNQEKIQTIVVLLFSLSYKLSSWNKRWKVKQRVSSVIMTGMSKASANFWNFNLHELELCTSVVYDQRFHCLYKGSNMIRATACLSFRLCLFSWNKAEQEILLKVSKRTRTSTGIIN